MTVVTLVRGPSTDEGTFGQLTVDDITLSTGELPWRDNQHGRSCIPTGTYECAWMDHPTHGWCYEVLGVPDRSSILIHSGNYCGDCNLGYRSDFEGCIGLGLSVGSLNGQQALTGSRLAIDRFQTHMNQQPFTLEIT